MINESDESLRIGWEKRGFSRRGTRWLKPTEIIRRGKTLMISKYSDSVLKIKGEEWKISGSEVKNVYSVDKRARLIRTFGAGVLGIIVLGASFSAGNMEYAWIGIVCFAAALYHFWLGHYKILVIETAEDHIEIQSWDDVRSMQALREIISNAAIADAKENEERMRAGESRKSLESRQTETNTLTEIWNSHPEQGKNRGENGRKTVMYFGIAFLVLLIGYLSYFFGFLPIGSDAVSFVGKSVQYLKFSHYISESNEEYGVGTYEVRNAIFSDTDGDQIIDGAGCNEKGIYNILGIKVDDDYKKTVNDLDASFEELYTIGTARTGQAVYYSEEDHIALRIKYKKNKVDGITYIKMNKQEIKEMEEAKMQDEATPEPTPIPTPEPTPYVNPYYYSDDTWDDSADDDEDIWDDEEEGDYILPYSDTRKLKKSDLRDLTKQELRLARNEIYARHGRLFDSEDLQDYFDEKDWYDGYIDPEDFVDSEELNRIERYNAKFILKYENSH